MRTPEEIKKGLECCHVGHCDCEECPYEHTNSCMHYLKQDALTLIHQLEAKVPKWISVEERLPVTWENVLTVNGHGEIRIMALFNKVGDNWDWLMDERLYHFNDITHWMRLPQPPKED